MAERRRLPVVQEPAKGPGTGSGQGGDAPPEGDEARPPWQWVGFGVVAIFAAWLPLAAAAAALARQAFTRTFGADATQDDVALALAAMSGAERMRFTTTQALPQIVALSLAAFAGGLLVGRFGTGTGAREAALSGAATAMMATALTARGLDLGWTTVLTVALTFALAAGFAAWGGRVGARRRAA